MSGDQLDKSPQGGGPRRYRWPWLIALAVLIAVTLAVLWMSREIARTKQYRDGTSGFLLLHRPIS